MKTKIFAYLMTFVMAFQPLLAQAADLGSAFDNLLSGGTAVSVNSPGRYQSGARNSFVAGGLDMRVPRGASAPQLFSVTPPRIAAGCNGISAHFGGFSFISGAEFEQLLKSIASGAALGFVSMMVLKNLCPQCEAVVQFLKTMAQQAARLAKDSCQIGQNLARAFLDGASTSGETGSREVCGATISGLTGGDGDYLSAMNNTCTSVTKAVDAMLSANPEAQGNTPEAKAKREELKCVLGAGNVTWQRLRNFDFEGTTGGSEEGYKRKLLLMNMLGVELRPSGDEAKPASCPTGGGSENTVSGTEEDPKKVAFCPPKIQPADAVGMFMCGAPTATNVPPGDPSARVKEYCATFYAGSAESAGGSYNSIKGAKIYTCKEDDKVGCTQLDLSDASVLIGGVGFLTRINKLLLDGVDAVRKNEPMPTEVLMLMQVAPFPLYQAINAAAVYPSAAADLIDAMSILVAEQAAVAYLDESLRLSGRTGEAVGCLTPEQGRQILEAVASMRAANRERLKLIAQNINVQQALSEQIRQVNLAIQRQVMSADMLATGTYAQALTRSLTPTNAGASAPVKTP
jgi:hypothetical protein